MHDLHRHHRHGVPGQLAEKRELDAGEDVAMGGAATLEDELARPRHVRRVRRVAHRLQREIGFDRRREIGRAAMEQRPAAILALDRAQIARQIPLQGIVDLIEIMLQEDVFGRDGGVGLELVDPVPVRPLLLEQRRGGAIDGAVERRRILRRRLALQRKRACHRSSSLPCAVQNRATMVWGGRSLKPFSHRSEPHDATPTVADAACHSCVYRY
jgi:hypothetical protein